MHGSTSGDARRGPRLTGQDVNAKQSLAFAAHESTRLKLQQPEAKRWACQRRILAACHWWPRAPPHGAQDRRVPRGKRPCTRRGPVQRELTGKQLLAAAMVMAVALGLGVCGSGTGSGGMWGHLTTKEGLIRRAMMAIGAEPPGPASEGVVFAFAGPGAFSGGPPHACAGWTAGPRTPGHCRGWLQPFWETMVFNATGPPGCTWACGPLQLRGEGGPFEPM